MWLLTKFLLLWCLLQSMLFWPSSLYPRPWLLVLAALILLVFNHKKIFTSNIPIIGLFISTLLIIFDSIIISGIIPTLAIASTYFAGFCLYRMKESLKIDLLSFVTKWFGIIIGISLTAYVIWLITDYPPFSILHEPYGYSNHRNFIFFILSQTNLEITRFSGPFIEPGHLGTIAVFIIYANKFDFKNIPYLWYILAAVLFSLSLAGYVLLALAYILYRGVNPKHVASIAIFLLLIYYSSTELWNQGDNPINEKIIERLQYDDEKGISGNNRNLYSTDLYFAKMVKDGSIVLGLGNKQNNELLEKKKIGGAGITVYLIYNGIIGLILVLSYYFAIAYNGIDPKFSYGFFILICFCFLQRAYPFWMAWLIPYISSISVHKNKSIALNP